MNGYLLVFLAALITAAVVMTVTALTARRAGRVSVVDTAWGIGLFLIALVSAVVGEGDVVRRWLLVGLVAVWGLRLSWHMHRRNSGKGEDPRYEKMLDGGGFRAAIFKVFVVQGAALWLVSLPVQIAAQADGAWGWIGFVGTALWLLGFVFESVGDAQLAAYKRDPDRGPVMDRGLWSWTRHPNYFGDACVWWGIWLISIDASWWALAAVVSPLAMTYFLVFATGARLLEQTMMKRPGYPEYAARTSMFFPLPPRPVSSGPAN